MADYNKKNLISYNNPSDCYNRITELNNLYKKTFNKNSKVELFFSSAGSEQKPKYSIVAYLSQEKQDELDNKADLSFFERTLDELEETRKNESK